MEREEAIKKVRQMSLPKETMEILEALAPELKESEDERIRKEMIGFLKSEKAFQTIDLPKSERWIAYLEKQKENAKSCDSIPSDCVSDAKYEDRSPKHSDSDGTDIRDTPAYWKGWDDAMKQKEQNHPNGCFTCDEYKKGYEAGRLNGFTAGYNKAMKEVDQKEQKQEWSEEDERMLIKLLLAIEPSNIYNEMRSWLLPKLESLRYQKLDASKLENFDPVDVLNRIKTEWPMAWEKVVGKQEWSEDYREEDIQTRFAFYTYKDDLGVLYLSNVFVEEASRNHGFGTKILIAAEKVAETIGATTISLKVKQDSPANAWYRKNGYGYVAFEDGYDWLEKNLEYMKPVKSAEWSKEETKDLVHILKVLDDCYIYGKHDLSKTDYDNLTSMIKSLRPSLKPSEDEERLINTSISFLKDFADKGYENAVECIDWLKSKLNGNACK